MNTASNLFLAALLFVAVFVASANWIMVALSWRARRVGSGRHFSIVPLVPQFFAYLGAVLSSKWTAVGAVSGKFAVAIPPWVFGVVAFADVTLWWLLAWLFESLWRRMRRGGGADR